MYMMSRIFLLISIIIVINSCDTTNPDNDHTTYSGVKMTLSKDGDPSINDTVTIKCLYYINHLPEGMEADTFITSGYFKTSNRWWDIVSGDSCWADTVIFQEKKSHSISLKPLQQGSFYVHASVRVDLNLPDGSYLVQDGVVFIDVR